MEDLTVQESMIPVEKLGDIVQNLMRPVLEALAKTLENNTAAMEQLAMQQQIQSERLEALEKQIRLQMPVTGKQAGYLNAAARERAKKLLDKSGVTDEKAVKKLAGIIRRDTLKHYGIGSMREVPGYEYAIALEGIETWSNPAIVMRMKND